MDLENLSKIEKEKMLQSHKNNISLKTMLVHCNEVCACCALTV